MSSANASQDMLTLCSVHRPEHHLEVDEGLAMQLAQLSPALCGCAAHVAARRFDDAIRCLAYILSLASLCDGPLQRLAKIKADGLARRLLQTRLGTISRALIDPSSYFDQRSIRTARYNFVKLLPFLKMAYVAINRVILDAMENEKFVHIIDLSGPAAHPWQWLKLMRAFRRRRPEGAPDLRITVVHDDAAFLAETCALLREKAEALDMAFSFHGFLGGGRLETLDLGGNNLHDALAIKSGYARAFSCALQMHRLLAVQETMKMNLDLHVHPSPTTPLSPFAQATTPSPQCLVVPPLLARFLSAARAASPKVVAVAEQEASHNGPDYAARFAAALHYYAALFDALDEEGRLQTHMQEEQRAQVEQLLLGEEIRNMLTRDGVERHERHEPLQQWAARMASAGFEAVPLSYAAKMEADDVLRKRRVKRGYENRPHDGCLLLCRSGRPLYAVSAWRPWPSEASVFGSSQQQQHTVVMPGQMTSTSTWPQQQTPVHSFTG